MKRKRHTTYERRDTKHYRCKNHPDRYPAARHPETLEDLCWECLLGLKGFKKKFGDMAAVYYQPGMPGHAGPAPAASGD